MKSAVDNDKRTGRLLGMISKADATIRKTQDPSTCLLVFAGKRTVKCPAAVLTTLMKQGAVRMDGDTIRITDAGEAALTRRDMGTFQGQHRSTRETPTGKGIAIVNDAESPLSALARLRRPDGACWLETREISAGERLRTDFERAMLQPRVTSSWDESHVARSRGQVGNGVADLTDHALSARDRVHDATEAVGPELSGMLIDICCFLKGLEQVERERGWPRRSAKLMLKVALGILDRYYHPPARATAASRRMRHWGGRDYRPDFC